ncbi:MAG: hypothetical protein Q7T18_13000, partial [Sedimentisphaerales bacterium]|nr:hypothetical protein [Sedimentisphaerales bacterium]
PYSSASSFATYKQIVIDRDLTISNSHNYWVYFLSPIERGIFRVHADGSAREKVADINSSVSDRARLFVLPSQEPNAYDLWTDLPKKFLMSKFAIKTALTQYPRYPDGNIEIIDEPNKLHDVYYTNFSYSYTDFRDPNQRAWKPSLSWPWHGLILHNETSKKQWVIKFETPFLAWVIQSPIFLPGDFVIFQLGDQIVLLDINNRKIRLITLGRGPVVTMD